MKRGRQVSGYRATINRITGGLCDARHVEAYMRVGHPTLDSLNVHEFRQEARLAMACIVDGGLRAAESLAQSFGI